MKLPFLPALLVTAVYCAANSAHAQVIDGGQGHTCALDLQGLTWCWGTDSHQQQGNGGGDDATSLPQRSGPPIVFDQIVAAGVQTCGRTSAGSVWCWGGNSYGQLGNGDYVSEDEPALVSGIVAASVASGDHGTCAIRSNGKIACWGDFMIASPGGQDNKTGPTDITIDSLVSFEQVVVGAKHACALNKAGAAWCWGDNSEGQLGIGSEGESNVQPAIVKSPVGTRFTSIVAGGLHTCAIDDAEKLWCWGAGYAYQLGNAVPLNETIPTKVYLPAAVRVHRVALGAAHTCMLDQSRQVWCWGQNNAGQSADGDSSANVAQPRLVEFPVDEEPRFESIGAGDDHTCAVSTEGEVWCWGDGMDGQLGLGYFGSQSSPAINPMLTGLSGVTGGSFHSCALDSAKNALCWGANSHGELGRGDQADSGTPIPVDTSSLPAGSKFSQISAGTQHTCAVLESGSGLCWGLAADGRLGDGITEGGFLTSPVEVAMPPGSPLDEVSAGGSHTCGLDVEGGLWCWGSNSSGQLGDGSDNTQQLAPLHIDVPGKSFQSVAAGDEHTCAVDTQLGSVYCWGENGSGQLGFGDTTDRNVPTSWPGITNFGFYKVVAGRDHTCALRSVPNDPSISMVVCWGENGQGQVGDGSTTDRSAFVNGYVEGGWSSPNRGHLSLGENHTCVRRPGGNTECWGDNSMRQLGDGSNVDSLIPVAASFQAVAELAAGTEHTCALNGSGQLACVGSRRTGQLADERLGQVPQPQMLAGFVAFTTGVFSNSFE